MARLLPCVQGVGSFFLLQIIVLSLFLLISVHGRGDRATNLANYTGNDFCSFNITTRSVQKLRDTLSQDPSIIFVNVKWYNDALWAQHYILTGKTPIIDPYVKGSHWPKHEDNPWPQRDFSYPVPLFVFALVFKGKGRSLYTLPYIMRPLSLGSLNPGVVDLDLEISYNPMMKRPDNDSCAMMVNASSRKLVWQDRNPTSTYELINVSDTWYSIQQTLIFGTQNILNNLTKEQKSNSVPTLDLICQSILTHNLQISPVFGNTFTLLYTTETHCDPSLQNAKENELTRGYGNNHLDFFFYFNFLNRTAVTLAVILSICVPFLALLFQRKNPPKTATHQGYKIMLSKDTDLPVGVKHVLFYWSPNGKCAVIASVVRIISVIVLITFLLYPEFLLFKLMDTFYDQRVSQIRSMPFQICILFYKGCFDSSYDVHMKMVKVSFVPLLVELTIVVILSLCKFKRVQIVEDRIFVESDLERRTILSFHTLPIEFQIPKHPDTMATGLSTLLYYAKWRINLVLNCDMWVQFIAKIFEKTGQRFCRMPNVLRLILALLVLPFVFLYATMLITINSLIAIPSVYIVVKSFHIVHLFKSKIISIFLFFFHGMVVFTFCCRFFHFMYMLGVVLVLTFTGLVMNSSAINSYYIFALSLLGFILKSFVDVYDTYYQIFQITLQKATKLSNESDSMQSIVLGKTINDISIDADLFWFVVNKCQPLRMKVASVVAQILVAFLAVGIGVHIIALSSQLENFSDISVALVTLLAATIMPQVITYVKSSASREQDKRLFADEIEEAVREYATNEFDADDDPILDIEESCDNYREQEFGSCYRCIGWCYIVLFVFGLIVMVSFLLVDIEWFDTFNYYNS